MSKYLGILTATVATLGLMCQGAAATTRHHHHHSHAVKAVSIGASVASTVAIVRLASHHRGIAVAARGARGVRGHGVGKWGAYGLTTVGCMAGSTILGAILVSATEHRELRKSEAFELVGNCIVPFVGGWIMQSAFAAHPEWDR